MMKNKSLVFVFAFLVVLLLASSVSAVCHTFTGGMAGPGGLMAKKLYIDPSDDIITKAEVDFVPSYITQTEIQKGFKPKKPFSPLNTISLHYETREIKASECVGGNINHPTIFVPKWILTLEDSSEKIYGSLEINDLPVASDYSYAISDPILYYYNDDFSVRYKGDIRVNLRTIMSESMFEKFVAAIDAGKKFNFVIKPNYYPGTGIGPFDGDTVSPPFDVDVINDRHKESDSLKTVIPVPLSNCHRDHGNGPIKLVTTFEPTKDVYISDTESIEGVSLSDFISRIVGTDFLNIDPYVAYKNKFSFYDYLGDPEKADSDKCAGAKAYGVLGNGQYGTEEKVDRNKFYVPLSVYGLYAPSLAQNYLHGLSHPFADLSDENINNPAPVVIKTNTNCRETGDYSRWGFWSDSYYGCGTPSAIRSSAESLMNLGNLAGYNAPLMGGFNIVSCSYVMQNLKKGAKYTDNVKECYYDMSIIEPSLSGIPILFPDGTVAGGV